jgi:hypothetical protein
LRDQSATHRQRATARRVVRDILDVELGSSEVETLRRRWPLCYGGRCDDDGGGGLPLRFCCCCCGALCERNKRKGQGTGEVERRVERRCHLSRCPRIIFVFIEFKQVVDSEWVGVVTCYAKRWLHTVLTTSRQRHVSSQVALSYLKCCYTTVSLSSVFARWHILSQGSET